MNEESLFARLIEMPVEGRTVFLDEQCAGRPELRERIEIIVGDQLLIASQRGKLSLVTTDRSSEIVATHDFAESIMATPAVVDGTIYLRTETQLYALGTMGKKE